MLLAPVVEARKGEHLQVLEELRAQGFVRARIDGESFELDQPPKLDLRRKHVIEAVVDRFKVRPDIQLRLAESFETALQAVRRSGAHCLDGQDRQRGAAVLGEVCLPRMRLFNQPNWNRGCSRSTTRPAPARNATASACASSSIPSAWWHTRNSASPVAPCAAGTGATPITSS